MRGEDFRYGPAIRNLNKARAVASFRLELEFYLSLLSSSSMGLSLSSLFTSLYTLVRWSKDQDVRILMLGLDSAGKVAFSGPSVIRLLNHHR
jgi:hypothetical protein